MTFNTSDYFEAMNISDMSLYEQNCTLADLRPHEFNDSALDAYNISSEDEESLMRCSYDASRINCSETDYLCLCAKEIYRDYCLGRPEYYSYIYRIIGTLFQGIIFIIGVIGNAMVVIVVARNKNMATPTNCYLVSLAVADCAVLVAAVPQEIVSYFLIGNHWIWGRGGCAIMIFLQNLGINASSLSLTAFTVERYIAICHPMKAQTVCTVERAKKITLLVWLFAVCYCAPWLFLTQVVPLKYAVDYPTQECTFKLSRDQYLYYYFLDFVVFYVVPLLLSCVLYSFIARILFTSQIPKNPTLNGHHQKRTATSARVQVVKMLAVVVAIFATLWLPYRTLLVYNSLLAMFGFHPYKDLWYLLFAKTCIFINSAINPILYNALSVKFRRAFKRMLSCGRPRRDQWGMTMLYSEGGRRPPSRGTPGGMGLGRETSSSPRLLYPPTTTRDAPTLETAFNTNSAPLKINN
ncbi:thyrotropin-releasing hormone receptor-like [Penaeus japonicus]|uniref:thyrotropin-releasing hormone receptor-like n=1 Tax=Penaeus japonicus TaxID=27405 RepID=UPI001C715F63|nr:thyrotropin-releasing hormone receptor-like [Penaeus japonicus]